MTTTQWQAVSLVSKILAISINLVANVIVFRILDPAEWGLVGLALSTVGSISVLHHLGIPAGITREIAKEKKPQNIPTVIASSLTLRLPVSVVLALGVYLFAPFISDTIYQNVDLVQFIRLLAVFIVIDGVQDIFSTSVGALKLFKGLFVFQVVLALANAAAMVFGVQTYGAVGYIYAKYVYMVVSLVVFGAVLVRHFMKQHVQFWHIHTVVIKGYIQGIWHIGSVAFLQKILHIYWQKLPVMALGVLLPIELVGIFSFAEFFFQKVSVVADAATDVSAPVFLQIFYKDKKAFVVALRKNFEKVFAATAGVLIIGTLVIADFQQLTGLTKYTDISWLFFWGGLAVSGMAIMSSVMVAFIAENMRKEMVTAYILLFFVTAVALYPAIQTFEVLGAAVAYAAGAISALVYMLYHLNKLYHFRRTSNVRNVE